ncbi:uncharacterized protein LOC108665265 [Hyalella azteca]|uniref:Uncharacterized protein LOC108665265 n=1 Tax=Hyalella azteca TaxID=294128 RepID=A0A8B7N1Q7_HYAAZ|nr:uncharacterized protein LOC108665265 [Hyalella azteca]
MSCRGSVFLIATAMVAALTPASGCFTLFPVPLKTLTTAVQCAAPASYISNCGNTACTTDLDCGIIDQCCSVSGCPGGDGKRCVTRCPDALPINIGCPGYKQCTLTQDCNVTNLDICCPFAGCHLCVHFPTPTKVPT